MIIAVFIIMLIIMLLLSPVISRMVTVPRVSEHNAAGERKYDGSYNE
jgi:hypothetical protein